jgi:hypothetical protein
VAQLGGAGAGLELLLPAQGRFIFQQQSEPFGMIETARLGFVFEVLKPLGEAMEAERVQLVERGMGEHGKSLSVEVAGATQIGVVEERGGAVVLADGALGVARQQRGDALAVEDAQFDGAGGDGFEARDIETAIGAQNPQAGAEALFGMGPAGEHG